MIEIGKSKASKMPSGGKIKNTLEDIEAIGESEDILDECLALAIQILTVVPTDIFKENGMKEDEIKDNILEIEQRMIGYLAEGVIEEMEGE